MRRPIYSYAFVALACLPVLFLCWQHRDLAHFGQFDDDGIYTVTARALAEGRGYRIESLPGAPLQTKYPPLYPALLAVAWKLSPAPFPGNLPWLLLVQAVVFLAVVAAAAAWLHANRLPVRLAAFVALSPVSAILSSNLLADTLFTALTLTAITFCTKRTRASAWLAGLLAALAYLTRTAALVLLPALVLAALLARRRDLAWRVALPQLAAIAAWHIWLAASLPPHLETVQFYYLDYARINAWNLQGLPWTTLLQKNAEVLLSSLCNLLVFNNSDWPFGHHAARLALFASIAGIVRRWRSKGPDAMPLFAAALTALSLVWSYTPNERLLYPLLPLLLAGLWTELSALASMIAASWRKSSLPNRAAAAVLASVAAAVLLLSAAGAWTGLTHTIPVHLSSERTAATHRSALWQFISKQTRPQTTFLAFNGGALHLHTGRHYYALRTPTSFFYKGDRAGWVGAFSNAASHAQSARASYILFGAPDYWNDLDPDANHRVRAALDRDPRLQPLFTAGPYRIYKLAASR
ncbi:MAG: hypothetical protein SFV54_00930 [Bryobacteraceae bacterium]|nr:hypothetical protein [Bryobacteraceae bacterium]